MIAISFTLAGRHFELSEEDVRSRIAQHQHDQIDTYWVEIDGTRWPVKQVLALATGLPKSDFQSQNSRRLLAKLGFTIGSGNAAIQAVPKPTHRPEGAAGMGLLAPVPPLPRADIVLVGCVKTKLVHGARARDLYASDYFLKMRQYAEASGLPWFILSAEHGLVAPEDWLEPYERYLPETSREYRHDWGERVALQLEEATGQLTGVVVDVHAGAAYVEAVERAVAPRGAVVLDQLHGLPFGHRLSWYLQRASASPEPLDQVVARLRDSESAWSLGDLLGSGGLELRSPGLYSWWVDQPGADDLTNGLGHQIEPGLIYAGLAGATQSGGSASSNTLWGRIATMHLGGRHEFSTLRRSIGSILARTFEQPTIDEEQLTRWMHAHLRVVTIPVADADSLGELESAVLTELDPPLNLAKVPANPLRRQLKAQRKTYAGRSSEIGEAG